jgi:hypothetical protein
MYFLKGPFYHRLEITLIYYSIAVGKKVIKSRRFGVLCKRNETEMLNTEYVDVINVPLRNFSLFQIQ